MYSGNTLRKIEDCDPKIQSQSSQKIEDCDRFRSPRLKIEDYEKAIVVLIAVLVAVLIVVLIVVLDFRAIRTTTRTTIENRDRFSQSSIYNSRTAKNDSGTTKKRFEVKFDS